MKVCTKNTLSAAEEEIGRLRNAGFHPINLSLSAPLMASGNRGEIPIEVPAEEAELAKGWLESHTQEN